MVSACGRVESGFEITGRWEDEEEGLAECPERVIQLHLRIEY